MAEWTLIARETAQEVLVMTSKARQKKTPRVVAAATAGAKSALRDGCATVAVRDSGLASAATSWIVAAECGDGHESRAAVLAGACAVTGCSQFSAEVRAGGAHSC